MSLTVWARENWELRWWLLSQFGLNPETRPTVVVRATTWSTALGSQTRPQGRLLQGCRRNQETDSWTPPTHSWSLWGGPFWPRSRTNAGPKRTKGSVYLPQLGGLTWKWGLGQTMSSRVVPTSWKSSGWSSVHSAYLSKEYRWTNFLNIKELLEINF